MCFHYNYFPSPTLLPPSLIQFCVGLFVCFSKSTKTNLCCLNIPGCLDHGAVFDLQGLKSLENCFSLSQQLTTLNSSISRGRMLCPTPISMDLLGLTQVLCVQTTVGFYGQLPCYAKDIVSWWSSTASDSYTLPVPLLQWSLSLGVGWGIHYVFRLQLSVLQSLTLCTFLGLLCVPVFSTISWNWKLFWWKPRDVLIYGYNNVSVEVSLILCPVIWDCTFISWPLSPK